MNKMNSKKLFSKSEYKETLFFLIIFALILGIELGHLRENLRMHSSIVLLRPILFSDSIFETLANICLFIIPAVMFLMALRKKQFMLKIAYLCGGVSLILTNNIINRLDYKSLYGLKIVLLFAAVALLNKYLTKTTEKIFGEEEC